MITLSDITLYSLLSKNISIENMLDWQKTRRIKKRPNKRRLS